MGSSAATTSFSPGSMMLEDSWLPWHHPLQVPLPCPSKGLVLTRVLCAAKQFSWHKSLPACSGCYLPAGCFSQPNQTPRQAEPPTLSCRLCSICSALHQCHRGKHANSGRPSSRRTPPPREHRVQAQCGHTSNVGRDAFYPHETGPCGASPVSKQHQVGPAALSAPGVLLQFWGLLLPAWPPCLLPEQLCSSSGMETSL